MIEKDGIDMRLIAGSAYGAVSPVKTFSPMFYLGAEAQADAALELPDEHQERALYIVSGGVRIDGEDHGGGRMVVFHNGAAPNIEVTHASRLMLLGGAPLGPRVIWWNLVATTQDRIDRAKADWTASADAQFENSVFSLPPSETEFIPLPEK